MMMVNYSQVSYFILTAFFDTGMFQYLYFLILLCLYVLIIVSNVFQIMVICVNRSLHEPMYLFLCSLFVNEVYGSTGLFPFLMDQVLRDVHTVSASVCFLQIFCIHSYGKIEFFTLGIMSYDRYVAICHPLQYNTRMTSTCVAILIAFVWVQNILQTAVIVSLSSSLRLCGNVIDKVYCINFSVIKLACSDTIARNAFGLTYLLIVILGLFVLILYTYMRILKVCFSGSKQTRRKAISTCTPHLASLLSFSFGGFFEIIQGRFNMSRIPAMVRIFLSLYFLTVQPLLSPLIFGLKIAKIRNSCKSVLLRKWH